MNVQKEARGNCPCLLHILKNVILGKSRRIGRAIWKSSAKETFSEIFSIQLSLVTFINFTKSHLVLSPGIMITVWNLHDSILVTKEDENSLVDTFYCKLNNINILDPYFQRKVSLGDISRLKSTLRLPFLKQFIVDILRLLLYAYIRQSVLSYSVFSGTGFIVDEPSMLILSGCRRWSSWP